MDSLQDSSLKIKKKSRNTNVGERNFLCGGCNRAYKSYPALYLHIKRKHDGVRPLNTKAAKPTLSMTKDKIHTGRPQKPSHDVDGVAENQIYLENAQSELLGFLGERLKLVSSMDAKPKLDAIVTGISNVSNETKDEAMEELKREIEDLYKELKETTVYTFDIELDYDTFQNLDKENSIRILSWFLLWIGKYIVKFEAIRDLTFVFAKIWKNLKQKDLQIQDLDNKLVWNGVMKECEPQLATFLSFEGKKDLLYEFISKVCHLIGKVFE